MVLKNSSFENGWTDVYAGNDFGHLTNQQPTDWRLRWLWPGESLFGSDEAHGVPECVHKLADQLPPNERPGGSDPLILDGEAVYKVFHNGAAFGAELWQVVSGLVPDSVARITVPVRIHAHGEKDNPDSYAAESGVWLLDEWEMQDDMLIPVHGDGDWEPLSRERQWKIIPGVKPDGWMWFVHEEQITVPDSGEICVLVRVKSKWDKPVDFFIDDLTLEADGDGTEPPPIEPPPVDDELAERVDVLETAVISLAQQNAKLGQRISALEAASHTHDGGGNPPPATDKAFGVDVSHWQGVMDWAKAKANGVQFAFIKATEHNSHADTQFSRNWEKARENGILRGAYHFYRFGYDPIAQANWFLAHIPANDVGELPLVVDVEDTDQPAQAAELKRFLDAIEAKRGRKPIIYTARWWWNAARWGGAVDWASDYDLWVANYTTAQAPVWPTDWGDWAFWQFTSEGDGRGYGASSNHIDLNWFHGSYVDLLAYAEAEIPPIEPPPVGDSVDLTPYFVSPADVGHWLVFRKIHDGVDVGTIDHQNQLVDGVTLRLKGNPSAAEYEELRASEGYIWRRYDTSPGNGRYYGLNDEGYQWSKWCPSLWRVGQTYERNPFVSWFKKSDCSLLKKPSVETTYLTFAALHKTWRGGDDGVMFKDVVELHWTFAPDGTWAERYFLAPRYGYVGWESASGRFHYCVSVELGREPMKREVIGCLD